MTITSTGTFLDSSFNPSVSCTAVKIDGPGIASVGGNGIGSPDLVMRGSEAGSGVHCREMLNFPSIPVWSTTVAPRADDKAPANWVMETLDAFNVLSPEGVRLNRMLGSSTGGASFAPFRPVTRA